MPEATSTGDPQVTSQPGAAGEPAGTTSPVLTPPAIDGGTPPSASGVVPTPVAATPPNGNADPTTATEEPTGFEWNDAVYGALGFKEHDGEQWAYYEEDPELGTIAYRDIDALRKGTREKQRHILRQQQALEQATARVQEFEQRLAERDRDLTLFSQRLSDEQLDELFTRKYLSEAHPEFKDVASEDELADPAQRANFRKASVDARARVLFERQQLEVQQQQEAALVQAAAREAEQYYVQRMSRDSAAKVWGVRNTEEVSALNEFLIRPSGRKRSDGSPASLAEEIFDVAMRSSAAAADIFLDGLKNRFWEEYRGRPAAPAAPKPPVSLQPEEPPAPLQERVISKSSPPPAPIAPQVPEPPKDARSRIREGFRSQLNAPKGPYGQR